MQENDQERLEITLRHAITVTNYRVQVLSFPEEEGKRRWPAREYPRKWADSSELGSLPLTGLARKILRRLQILPNGQEAVIWKVR
jgi:A/G-specific adenine glycosylase